MPPFLLACHVRYVPTLETSLVTNYMVNLEFNLAWITFAVMTEYDRHSHRSLVCDLGVWMHLHTHRYIANTT